MKAGAVGQCEWCDAPVRNAPVLVGQPPGQLVKLWIDVEPHPAGVVIQRDDGKLRMLSPRRARRSARSPEGKPAFRVHSRRTCGAGA